VINVQSLIASVGESHVVNITQVTSLILVDARVKISEAYYRNMMLLQQFLPAMVMSDLKGVFHLLAGQCPGAQGMLGNQLHVTSPDVDQF